MAETAGGCGWQGMTAFVAGVVMGTACSIVIKVLYMMEAVGMEGYSKLFEKPLTTVFFMFLAMALALPTHWLHQHFFVRTVKGEERVTHMTWKVALLLALPSIFDLIGTALASIGLLFLSVSIYQLMRCTVIIFTALLKRFVLKDKLLPHMWLGVIINVVAMTLVSTTTFFDRENVQGNRDPRVGIFFILLSCLVQGSQYVFEEKVMHVDGVPPLVVVGMEGVWGTVLMVLVVFPVAYYIPGADAGSVENVWDSWVMIRHSQPIQAVLWVFVITVALYNVFAVFVTHFLSSVWHAILDNFRPISVWGTDLAIYYLINKEFGESWTRYSWIQFAGMLVLFIGTAVYNGSIPVLDLRGYLPLSEFPPVERRVSLERITPKIRTPDKMSSPYLMRSPMLRTAQLSTPQVPRQNSLPYGAAGDRGRSASLQFPHSYGSTKQRTDNWTTINR